MSYPIIQQYVQRCWLHELIFDGLLLVGCCAKWQAVCIDSMSPFAHVGGLSKLRSSLAWKDKVVDDKSFISCHLSFCLQ